MLLFIYIDISSYSHIRKPEQVLVRFFPLNCSAFDFVHTAFFALVIESTEAKKLTAQKEHLSVWILKNRDLHMKTQRFRKKAAAITSTMTSQRTKKREWKYPFQKEAAIQWSFRSADDHVKKNLINICSNSLLFFNNLGNYFTVHKTRTRTHFELSITIFSRTNRMRFPIFMDILSR